MVSAMYFTPSMALRTSGFLTMGDWKVTLVGVGFPAEQKPKTEVVGACWGSGSAKTQFGVLKTRQDELRLRRSGSVETWSIDRV